MTNNFFFNSPLLVQKIFYYQELFSQSICGAETGYFGLISENFDPFLGTYPLIYRSITLADLY